MTDFRPDVEAALRASGWRPGVTDRRRAAQPLLALSTYVARDGTRHQIVPSAAAVFGEFGDLGVDAVAHEDVAGSSVRLDPMPVLATTRLLAALAARTGEPLTPVGMEADGTGVIAVDALGRAFVLDHAGEWYLGASFGAGLTALLVGHAPLRLPDGPWTGP